MKFFECLNPENPGDYLNRILEDLEKRFQVTITLHDSRGLLYNGHGNHVFQDRRKHRHPFCMAQRYSTPFWNSCCLKDCFLGAESLARENFHPFLHPCWKGCVELLVPIPHRNTLFLLIYAGLFRMESSTPPEKLPDPLKEDFRNLPVADPAKLEELSRMLRMFGETVIACSGNLHREEDAERKSFRRHDIRNFLTENAHRSLKLNDLAEYLSLSTSRTGHLVRELFQTPFQDLLERERMIRAKHLLLQTEFPLKKIAEQIGMKNEYYFNQIFRKKYGIPPGRYRRIVRKEDSET